MLLLPLMLLHGVDVVVNTVVVAYVDAAVDAYAAVVVA